MREPRKERKKNILKEGKVDCEKIEPAQILEGCCVPEISGISGQNPSNCNPMPSVESGGIPENSETYTVWKPQGVETGCRIKRARNRSCLEKCGVSRQGVGSKIRKLSFEQKGVVDGLYQGN